MTQPTYRDFLLEELLGTAPTDIQNINHITNIFFQIRKNDEEEHGHPVIEYDLCDANQQRIDFGSILEFEGQPLTHPTLIFECSDVIKLFYWIKEGKVSGISNLKIYFRESMRQSKHLGIHYYYEPVFKTPKKKQVESLPGNACQNCDNFLLTKYPYNDLHQSHCPYCSQELKIIQRSRRYIQISCKDIFTGHWMKDKNYGHMEYHGRNISLTLKLNQFRLFLLSFQSLTDGKIGPFSIQLANTRYVDVMNFEPEPFSEDFWHEASLFPEDLFM